MQRRGRKLGGERSDHLSGEANRGQAVAAKCFLTDQCTSNLKTQPGLGEKTRKNKRNNINSCYMKELKCPDLIN